MFPHSLRQRLTAMYVTLIGGLLMLASVTIYFLVGFLWQGHVDALLRTTADQILETMSVAQLNGNNLRAAAAAARPDTIIQLVRPTGEVVFSSSQRFQTALYNDKDVLLRTRYALVETENRPALRVLSTPLVVNGRTTWILQVGMLADVAQMTQKNLLWIFLTLTLFLMAFALAIGRQVSANALRPLEELAERALTITRADDLSVRIPLRGYPDDEVGQVISAFNTTLERLEVLFTSQQRFLADVSHELRTPLTVIKGNVGLMRRMADYDPELLTSIEAEADRLTRMVESLLLLAKAESGRMPLQKTDVELDALLLDVLGAMQVLAADKVTLNLEAIDQVRLSADADRLKQVFVNLISNAIKYTPAGGQVFVGLDRQADMVRVWVRDTGPGIPEEDLPHVFERFYRADKSRTRQKQAGGFGLGLSIAYWIVKNHDGRIEVASQLGEGTIFTVWLPLDASRAGTETRLPAE